MKRFLLSVILVLLAFPAAAAEKPAAKLQLWFYFPTNFLVDENVDRGISLLERAAKAGYTDVLITDSKFMRWDDMPQRYYDNLTRYREACRRVKIRCHAAVCPIGYSNDLLSRDPNLAEGQPVMDMPFTVKDGKLVPEQPAEPLVKNGGFEESRGDTPGGWAFVDGAGKFSFMDTAVKAEGRAALRFENIGPDGPANGRAMQPLAVKPFRYYHVSVMMKTEDFDAPASLNILLLTPEGQVLNHHMPRLEKTQDWTRLDVTFNSMTYENVNLYIGVWGSRRGKLWLDDVRVEPAGFVNVLRRESTPVKVKSEDGKTVYKEGKDFENITDPKLGNDPWQGCFSAWHEEPAVNVPADSRLKEGQRVLVSFYHTSIIYGEQVGCCMNESKVAEILRWQVRRVKEHVKPDGYFMSHDEIRQGGWDPTCVKSGKTPGEMLTDNVAACAAMIAEEDPGKPVAVWSDMFDPTHNAQKTGYYYLVKGEGPWYGAWEKLPKNVTVANWNMNPDIRKESLAHFASRGNRQILAGYYDSEPVGPPIRAWMQDAAAVKGVAGVMYTTWENRYDSLEDYAAAVKEEWGKINQNTSKSK